jgi:hypothetical protein
VEKSTLIRSTLDTLHLGSSAVSRRGAIKGAGALAMGAGALDMAAPLAFVPNRTKHRRPVAQRDGARGRVSVQELPDIQFDIGAVSAAPQIADTGVVFAMPPVHTFFLTATLKRTPHLADKTELNRVLATLERTYPFDAANLIAFVSYGLPYFRRLPGGLNGNLVGSRIPRLRSNTTRLALEEAVVSPTDVAPQNPDITKVRYQVPVRIEHNDLLFTLRSDNPQYLQDVIDWFGGSDTLRGQGVQSPRWGDLLSFTSSRYMFIQIGMPKAVALKNGLPFAKFVRQESPMWMGFADQQTNAAGPAQICTFTGNSSARLTTARPGDYFDNGSIQILAHDILDMLQFFDMAGPTAVPGDDAVFTERVQYMFHSPAINPGFLDQLTDGGGPSFLPAENRGPHYAAQTAAGIGTEDNEHRMGHLSCLQRSSRAADGTPIHMRMDGPGFDNMDVPDGSRQPKLQFTAFVPTSDFFATMRRNQASLDLQERFAVDEDENGLERFLTATRRQNFLIPPRRNRAFPLVELT